MDLLGKLIGFFETKFAYLYTAVSGAFSVILSEIPDDEITILHGAMATASTSLKSGRGVEGAFTDALNYVAAQELGELSKVGNYMLQAFINASAPPAS